MRGSVERAAQRYDNAGGVVPRALDSTSALLVCVFSRERLRQPATVCTRVWTGCPTRCPSATTKRTVWPSGESASSRAAARRAQGRAGSIYYVSQEALSSNPLLSAVVAAAADPPPTFFSLNLISSPSLPAALAPLSTLRSPPLPLYQPRVTDESDSKKQQS